MIRSRLSILKEFYQKQKANHHKGDYLLDNTYTMCVVLTKGSIIVVAIVVGKVLVGCPESRHHNVKIT